jgi:glutaredoxin
MFRKISGKNMSKTVVYSTPKCRYCGLLKAFLAEKGINFEEIDVSKDTRAGQEIFEKTHSLMVPILLIDDQIVIGYHRRRIEEILAKH